MHKTEGRYIPGCTIGSDNSATESTSPDWVWSRRHQTSCL